jgi:endogenous inhibitor of DNA gyrase (YacG/DUF329 family)
MGPGEGTRGRLLRMVGKARCPTCKEPVETEREKRPKDFPFCSERCRLVDLHKWLTGAYAIPGEDAVIPEGPLEE